MLKTFYVYIMTNQRNTVLYTGVTNNLIRRVLEHKNKVNNKSFTSKYNCNKLVFFESTESGAGAFEREVQIKGWLRQKKINMVNSLNPEWRDLFSDLCD